MWNKVIFVVYTDGGHYSYYSVPRFFPKNPTQYGLWYDCAFKAQWLSSWARKGPWCCCGGGLAGARNQKNFFGFNRYLPAQIWTQQWVSPSNKSKVLGIAAVRKRNSGTSWRPSKLLCLPVTASGGASMHMVSGFHGILGRSWWMMAGCWLSLTWYSFYNDQSLLWICCIGSTSLLVGSFFEFPWLGWVFSALIDVCWSGALWISGETKAPYDGPYCVAWLCFT